MDKDGGGVKACFFDCPELAFEKSHPEQREVAGRTRRVNPNMHSERENQAL
jgi:hypothetical protein